MGKNWAENFSNNLTICLEAGDWTITKDGEGVKELYYEDKSLCALPSLYYYADVFKSGIVLNAQKANGCTAFYAFKNGVETPTLQIEGQTLNMEKDGDLIIFKELTEEGIQEKAILDSHTFEQLTQELDGQIGFSF